MNEHTCVQHINLCVVKLNNSRAKAGPMSGASALGLACVPRLDLDVLNHNLIRSDLIRGSLDFGVPNQRRKAANSGSHRDAKISERETSAELNQS